MVYYVRVPDVFMTLACVCVRMLRGRSPMDNMYAITCHTCMFLCWAGPVVQVRTRPGPVMRVRVRPVILSGQGQLCK